MTHNDVLIRLAPKPKKLNVYGMTVINPSCLAICALDQSAWTRQAAAELALFIRQKTKALIPVVREAPGKGMTIIYLASEHDPQCLRHEFMDPFFADFTASPGFHSYRIKHLDGNNGLILQGLSSEGVYWGMKTIKQLMRFETRQVILPKVSVLDGADLEERGIWTQPFGLSTCPYKDRARSLRHYKAWIDWMSDHKMNLLEVVVAGEGGGIGFRSQKHPEFCHADAADREYLLKHLFLYGQSRGMRMIPIFTHGEHYDFIANKFPEVAARHAVRHHGHDVKLAINFFHHKTEAIFRDLAEELFSLLNPKELCFWLSENRLHSLPPDKQTKSEFLQEAEMFYGIVEHLRKTKPELEVKMCLTQGAFPENLALIHAMPRDVKWIFYSGERFGTYNIRPINPIHRDIANAARDGYWLSVCMPTRGIPARPAVFKIMKANIQHSVEAGLRGFCGMSYSYPADELGLFVESEHTWNSTGRSLDETFRAYAASLGVKDPQKQAEAYRLFDDANFAHGIRNAVCLGQPFGSFSRFQNMLERIRDNDKVDELIMVMADTMEVDDLPVLAKAVTDIAQAIDLADKKDPLFDLRARYLRHILRISMAIARAFYMNCREKSWDLYKGDWADFHDELRRLFRAIRKDATAGAPLYRRLVQLEKWAKSDGLSPKTPLAFLADLTKSIGVDKVKTSRD
ncbi:MAG: hypothetical protein KKD76_04735 [Verrucomicrobia bacterium]|nr:hypothetical protein [Verrucomicrobiota bacterium]